MVINSRMLAYLLFLLAVLGFFFQMPAILSGEEYIETIRIVPLEEEVSGLTRHTLCKNIKENPDCNRILKNKIEGIAKDYFFRNAPWEKKRVKVKNIEFSKISNLPAGEIVYDIIPSRNDNFLGRTEFFLLLEGENKWKKKLRVSADIGVLTPVALTSRRLKSGQIITKNDVHLGERDLSRIGPDIISDINEVLGKTTKTALNASIALRASLVEAPLLIRRGDIVTIIAESNFLTVTTLGEAREKGRKMDRIKVRNIASQKEVFAVVMDSKTVKVEL